MYGNKWKKLKQSGSFKRKREKIFQSLKSETSTSMVVISKTNDRQGRIADTEDKSNEASLVFNTSNGSEQINVVDVPSIHSFCSENNDYSNTGYLQLSEGPPCDNTDTDISTSSDNDIDVQFQEEFKKWALDFNISLEAMKSLSIVINKRLPNIVPRDPRTLLKTNHVNVTLISVDKGQYWHNGLSSPLQEILKNCSSVPDCIALTFNIDGLPLYKSSRKQVWPILCHIFEKQEISPFIVGIYAGEGKPSDLTAYLHHFVTEMKELLKNHLRVMSRDRTEVLCKVKIRAFICDSPARAMLKGVQNFNGKHGCLKCTVVGEYSQMSHTVVFPRIDCPKRNDADFRSKRYGKHHKYDSPLLELPIDMVEDIPVGDSLHLIDLGIMKRLLTGWRDGNFGKYLTKWCFKDITKVSQFLINCKMPCEIHRSVRSLDVLAHWKGSEFRTFLYYLSFIILNEVLCFEAFYHFLTFFCAITICSNEKHFMYLRLAEEMLKHFVTSYGIFYGKDYITSNVHNLSHLVEEVKRFGVLQNFNAYPFENKLFTIKKMVRQGNKPLSQIAKRIMERSYVELEHFDDNYKKKTPFVSTKRTTSGVVISVVDFGKFVLSQQTPDKWFLSTNDHVVEIISINGRDNNVVILGNHVQNCIDAFENPMKSSLINIYKCNINAVSKRKLTYQLTDVKCKFASVAYNEHIFFVPLVHTL